MDENPHSHPIRSPSEEELFYVRWRGKPEGPYAAEQIDAMLAANQIGLLHELNHQGEWLTLRDFMAKKEAAIRQQVAEAAALRREREALELQEREKAARHQAEQQAEQSRKAALAEAAANQQRQAMLARLDSPSRPSGSSSLRIIGILLLLGGLGVTAFFFFGFDPSVETGYGRVNNFGLMADRQDGILIGLGLAIVGTIMLVIGSRENT